MTPTMMSSPTWFLCSTRNWCSMSLTACERVAKPRASTIRSRSLSNSSGSEMLILLTGRLRECTLEQVAVALDFPLRDREVIGVPFHRLVLDELITQLPPQRRLHQRIGGEGRHRLVQCLRQELDIALLPLVFGDCIKIVLVRLARIDLLADALEPGGEHDSGGQIGIDRAVGIARLAAAAAIGHPHRVGAVVGSVGIEHRCPREGAHGALPYQPLVAVDRRRERRAQRATMPQDAADKVVAGLAQAEAARVLRRRA